MLGCDDIDLTKDISNFIDVLFDCMTESDQKCRQLLELFLLPNINQKNIYRNKFNMLLLKPRSRSGSSLFFDAVHENKRLTMKFLIKYVCNKQYHELSERQISEFLNNFQDAVDYKWKRLILSHYCQVFPMLKEYLNY